MSASLSEVVAERGAQLTPFEIWCIRDSALLDVAFARVEADLARPAAFSPEWMAELEKEMGL